MSSKKAKAARKAQNVTRSEFDNFGVLLPGLKFLGRPIYVAFGLYTSDQISEAFIQNSEEYNFQALAELPVLIGNVEELKTLIANNDDREAKGLSLGVVLIVDKSKLVRDEAGFPHLQTETFPFLVGEPRAWRNAKYGHFFDDEEVEADIEFRADMKAAYSELFPQFDAVYKIEQIIDTSGMSNSLDRIVDRAVLSLLS